MGAPRYLKPQFECLCKYCGEKFMAKSSRATFCLKDACAKARAREINQQKVEARRVAQERR